MFSDLLENVILKPFHDISDYLHSHARIILDIQRIAITSDIYFLYMSTSAHYFYSILCMIYFSTY